MLSVVNLHQQLNYSGFEQHAAACRSAKFNRSSGAADTDSMVKPQTQTGIMTLAGYVATQPEQAVRRCALCSLPLEVEQQLQQGKANRVTYRLMSEWLTSIGYSDIRKPRMERHFLDRHVHPMTGAGRE